MLFRSNNSEDSKKFAKYAIKVKMADKEANPLMNTDCRSFDFAQQPGWLQRWAVVKDFNHTFYTVGFRPNGSPYFGYKKSLVSVAYFSMPTWMTNSQAANKTARAVSNAVDATDIYYESRPDATGPELLQFFKNAINANLRVYGGSVTTTAPLNLNMPSPSRYIQNVEGIGGDPFDC